MPARRRRKKKSSSGRRLRLAVIGSLALLAGLAAAVSWLRTPAGRMTMADAGVTAAERWAQPHLEAVLLSTLARLEVPADSIVVEASRGDAETRVIRLSAEGSLTTLNLEITTAVEAAGGHVHRGRRSSDDQGEQLELRIGTANVLTHRLVARVGRLAEPPPAIAAGRIALVIDDLGHNLQALTRRALALPAPLTFAVLPELPYSERVLTEIHRSGRPALLHMPMESHPESGYEAGEPQIRVGMDRLAIATAVRRCLDGLPGVVGVNNHMGSKATESRPEMDAVMEVLSERGLVFLDSQTTPHSVAHLAAADRGVPTLRNDIFLDAGTEDPAVVEERLRFLMRKALDRGWAVGIGHVNEATIEGISRVLPEIAQAGIEMVPIAELIHDLDR